MLDGEKSKVLLVEDAWRIARFLQMELEHKGFQALTGTNGRRAWERMLQEDFDILLLDRMLPAKDGIEICRRVREISSILIIPLTAKDAAADKVCGLDSGADDYTTLRYLRAGDLPQKLSQKTKHLLRSGVRLHVAEADGTVHTDDMSWRDTLKTLLGETLWTFLSHSHLPQQAYWRNRPGPGHCQVDRGRARRQRKRLRHAQFRMFPICIASEKEQTHGMIKFSSIHTA